MVLCTRLVCLLTVMAAVAVCGCDKAQTLIDDAKKQADEMTASPAAGGAVETDSGEPAIPMASTPEPVPTTPAVVDDAALLTQWQATLPRDRSDAALRTLLQASPESLQDLTFFEF